MNGERFIEIRGTFSIEFPVIVGVGSTTYTATGKVVITSDESTRFHHSGCHRVSTHAMVMAQLRISGFS